ncbi:MAG: hypothetical protein U9N82_00710 [Thermodesulfobacteriota bacterium]|nr:hypothetical protein [Thermodesulfobacteriota bacterium]
MKDALKSFTYSSHRLNAAHGCHDQPHEKPPEGEHDDAMSPLWVLLEFIEENADNNMSASSRPHKGQLA